MMNNYLTHLECSNPSCGKTHSAQAEQHLCDCGSILLARYDLERVARELPRERISSRPWNEGLWRYAELLPVSNESDRVSLGEGATPLLPLDWLGTELGIE